MINTLENIATIHIGARVLPADASDVSAGAYLQTGDFDEFGRLIPFRPLTQIDKNQDVPERAWVKPGDILLTGKSNRNTAILYQEKYPIAVASATFFVLRVVDPDALLPAFLACYLNQPATQAQIRSRISSATTVPTLNKKDLLDLPVPILPMATQQCLVSLYNTFLTIRDLNTQIITHHENLVTQCFSTIISGQTHPPKN